MFAAVVFSLEVCYVHTTLVGIFLKRSVKSAGIYSAILSPSSTEVFSTGMLFNTRILYLELLNSVLTKSGYSNIPLELLSTLIYQQLKKSITISRSLCCP